MEFPYKIGIGYDVHVLVEGRALWLGGVNIPHTHGAEGHSDADVIIHAICDAILGAAGMRDIGFHFSNTDPQYKNIDSKKLLARVVEMVAEAGYAIGNVDCALVLQRPKISPFIIQMQDALAPILGVEKNCIGIKATTAEKLGFVGKEEGLEAQAVCIIYKK